MTLTWSDTLYRLYQRFGGCFLGTLDLTEDNSILHLNYRGIPLTLENREYLDSTDTFTRYRILTTCQLERPYQLNLHRKGPLELGKSIFRRCPLLSPYPELFREFALTTSHPNFTATVLRQPGFREALMRQNADLAVVPSVPDQTGLHRIELSVFWNELIDFDPSAHPSNATPNLSETVSERDRIQAELAELILPRLTNLMDLAVETHAALTAYPML